MDKGDTKIQIKKDEGDIKIHINEGLGDTKIQIKEDKRDTSTNRFREKENLPSIPPLGSVPDMCFCSK